MGKKHYGHSLSDWHHSHHSHHHHHRHDHLVGRRGDDVLVGSEKGNAIIGRKGNDALFGNAGNDWLDGGRGNDKLFGGEGHDWLVGGRGDDLLDGGAGSDKVYGGKGDDIAIYAVAENVSANAFGKGDFYDGGEGKDVLRLILTPEELANDAILADIGAYQKFLADNPGGCGRNGEIFKFESLNLAVRNFEVLEIEGGNPPPAESNTAPVGVDDLDVVVNEDEPTLIDVVANDVDSDGDALTAVLVDAPMHGTVIPVAPGVFEYTPHADYYGPDQFTYRASDGIDESGLTNVTIEVESENDAPRLKDENDPLVWVAGKGQLIFIDVLEHYDPGPANEADQTVAFRSVAPKGAFFGSYLGISPLNGAIVYIAPNGIPPGGHETFAVEVVDDFGAVATADVQIDIVL